MLGLTIITFTVFTIGCEAYQGSRCYECHFDPDFTKFQEAEWGQFPGYPKCAMYDSFSQEKVDKWECSGGKCFIRKDPNGLIYRGCADDANLPWDVDSSKSCTYQGQIPSLWFFCTGDICNGNAIGNNDFCSSDLSGNNLDGSYVETVHGDREDEAREVDSYNTRERNGVDFRYYSDRYINENDIPTHKPREESYKKREMGKNHVDKTQINQKEPVYPKQHTKFSPPNPKQVKPATDQKYHHGKIYNSKDQGRHQKSDSSRNNSQHLMNKYQSEENYMQQQPKTQDNDHKDNPKGNQNVGPNFYDDFHKSHVRIPNKLPSETGLNDKFMGSPYRGDRTQFQLPSETGFNNKFMGSAYRADTPIVPPETGGNVKSVGSANFSPNVKVNLPSETGLNDKFMGSSDFKGGNFNLPSNTGRNDKFMGSPDGEENESYRLSTKVNNKDNSFGKDGKKYSLPSEAGRNNKFMGSPDHSVKYVNEVDAKQGYNDKFLGSPNRPYKHEDSNITKFPRNDKFMGSPDPEIFPPKKDKFGEDEELAVYPMKPYMDLDDSYYDAYFNSGENNYGVDNYVVEDLPATDHDDNQYNPCDGHCFNNPSGLFPDSEDANRFIQCGDGIESGQTCRCCKPYFLHCPAGTRFDTYMRICS